MEPAVEIQVNVQHLLGGALTVLGLLVGAFAYTVKIGLKLGEVTTIQGEQARKLLLCDAAHSSIHRLQKDAEHCESRTGRCEKRIDDLETLTQKTTADLYGRLGPLESAQAAFAVSDRELRGQMERMSNTLMRIEERMTDLAVGMARLSANQDNT